MQKNEVESISVFQSTQIQDKDSVSDPAKILTSEYLRLRFKVLTHEHIVRRSTFNLTAHLSYLYYQLIARIHKLIQSEVKGIYFESVELFSETGYPLAVTPFKYLHRISEWNLEQNTMLYVYPKKISVQEFTSTVSGAGYSLSIPIEGTDITLSVMLCHIKIFCCDLKTVISLQLHLPIESIVLHLMSSERELKEIPDNRFELEMNLVIRKKILLSIQILAHWADESYLGAFNTDLYQSCVLQKTVVDWNCFNCLLLYLAKEQIKESREGLLAKLGLLRRISCSPPLVYAMYRLLTGCILCLPHRVAINEGILTTLYFLMPDRQPQIHYFPILWIYLEENAIPEHIVTEVYKTHYISKHTRERPRDSETKRLLQAYPPTGDTIITWSDSPTAHEPFSYKRLSEIEIYQNQISKRFPLQHPIELYRQYLMSGTDYGLLSPITRDLSSYCVFLGPTEGKYGYFNFFDPHKGKYISCNPHDIITSDQLQVKYQQLSPKLIIILDISMDMNLGCEEYKTGRDKNEANLIITSLDMAYRVIELLINNLIGAGSVYLLGMILISNDHHPKFTNGLFVLQDSTFEYAKTLKKLKEFVDNNPPIRYNFKRLPRGIIVNALFHMIERLVADRSGIKVHIFLLTNNQSDKKYYGNKKNMLEQKLTHHRLVLNTMIFPQGRSETLRVLTESNKGKYLDQICIDRENSKKLPSHYLLEYFSVFEDTLDPLDLPANFESYDRILDNFRKKVYNTDSTIDRVQENKEKFIDLFVTKKFPNLIQIMRQISQYTKSPNPFCRLFSIENSVQHWLCFIQGSDNSPYKNSVLFLEIRFGIRYPQKPPTFRFLSSYYHPNVRRTGEVCVPILFEDYHPGVNLRQIMDSIYDMICSPVYSHAVRYKVMEIFSFHKEVYMHFLRSFLNVYKFERSVSDCFQDFCIQSAPKTQHPEPSQANCSINQY